MLQDLEKLISKAVDPSKADYAVFTGIQIHNWSDKFEDDEPNFEFIMPGKSYVVVQGKKKEIDLSSISVRLCCLFCCWQSNPTSVWMMCLWAGPGIEDTRG